MKIKNVNLKYKMNNKIDRPFHSQYINIRPGMLSSVIAIVTEKSVLIVIVDRQTIKQLNREMTAGSVLSPEAGVVRSNKSHAKFFFA